VSQEIQDQLAQQDQLVPHQRSRVQLAQQVLQVQRALRQLLLVLQDQPALPEQPVSLAQREIQDLQVLLAQQVRLERPPTLAQLAPLGLEAAAEPKFCTNIMPSQG
jgi:hypothetical protein